MEDLGFCRERSVDFVCPGALPGGFTHFFLHFDSSNRASLPNFVKQ